MNTPKIRFKEFNDEWKYEPLSNYVDRIITKNKDNASSLVLTISAQFGLVDQTRFFNKNVSSNNLAGYYLLNKGDFAYNKSYSNGYPWGAIKRLNKYNMGVVSSLYICFKPNKKINSDYLEQYFETNKWYHQMSEVSVEGARNHGLLNIAVGDFFSTEHFIPTLDEQKKISKFLSLLYKKIELQSKKIEDLKLFKKGLIETEFTNSNYNEINLKNILKERKLYSEKGLEYPHVTLSKDGIYDKGERYNRDFLVKSEDKKYKITYLNDLCYNQANLKFGVICLNEYGSAIFSPIYVTFEINSIANPKYIKYYTMRNNFINAIRKYEQGTVYERMAVAPEDFLKFNIKLPNIETQNKIVLKLSKLDKKLQLEENKLSKLTVLKKGLMQSMFV